MSLHRMRALGVAVLAAVLGNVSSAPVACAEQKPTIEEGLAAAAARKYKAELPKIQALARRGDPDGLFHLGLMHFQGWGIAQDYAEALRLFSAAAEKGHAQALIWLGDAYAEGKGAPKDNIEAHKFYDLATTQAKRGDLELSEIYREMADKKKKDVASKMTKADIAEAQKRASEWRSKLSGQE